VDIFYVDGRFVDEGSASISVKDLIVLRGFGVFEFLVTYNKRPFRLEDHLERLEQSAVRIGLALRKSRAEMCEIVSETVRRNPHHKESGIRIVCTGGVSTDGVSPEGKGSLVVMATPRPVPPMQWYTEGAAVITVDAARFMPQVKSTNYLSAVCAQQEAKRRGAIEAVYVDRHNRILEGTTSNVFFCKGRTLVTPCDDILDGVTRRVVLELADGRFDIELRDVNKAELADFDEVFITSSSKEVVPVVKVDGVRVGTGRVGETTREIMGLFGQYTSAYGLGRLSHEHPRA
jgi:branched-chain amino acid aminotransferase